jgi:hypothetical protein
MQGGGTMTERQPAPELTLDDVVRRRADVGSLTDGGESVLFAAGASGGHRLDAIATVVWEQLDGSWSLRELSAELASAFGADRGVVERDVTRLVSDFYNQGLLERDASTVDDGSGPVGGPAEPQRPGEIRYVAVPPST